MAREGLKGMLVAVILYIPIFSIGLTDAITGHTCTTGNTTELIKLHNKRKAQSGVPCIFPFTLKGKIYHTCTYDFSHTTYYKPWCSTNVDENGKHVSGRNADGSRNWGICDENQKPLDCPIPPRRCGVPTSTRKKPLREGGFDDTTEIQQQPWMVSLGKWISFTRWEHQCAGSIITSKHILTAAHCFSRVMNADYSKIIPKELKRYTVRMGTADLDSVHSPGGTERRVVDIKIHPKYIPGEAHYDVGIAETREEISFNEFVRPVCLPYLPVDNDNYLSGQFVTLAGWGYVIKVRNNVEQPELTSNLKLRSLQVIDQAECEDIFSEAGLEDYDIDLNLRKQLLPFGFTSELACVVDESDDITRESRGSCDGDSGSPVIKRISGTAREEPYYEQHYIVSTGIDCRLQSTIYIRISQRNVLTWIQQVTDTTPLVMVVGGYTNYKEVKDPRTNRCIKDPETRRCILKKGLINDVELLSLSKKKNKCTKFVKPVFGAQYLLGQDENGLDILENDAELLGLTGVFSKDAAIVCGGQSGNGDQKACYEWDSNINAWKAKHVEIQMADGSWQRKHPDGIRSMEFKRFYASSVLNDNGDMWVLGGTAVNNASDTSEVYAYKPKGKGRWQKGHPLPPDYRDTGLESHCTVRINTTHIFMGAGFLTEHIAYDPTQYVAQEDYDYYDYGAQDYGDGAPQTKLPDVPNTRDRKRRQANNVADGAKFLAECYEAIAGAKQTNKTWMYDGNVWKAKAEMKIARDRPACSLVNMPDGKVNILVSGGCDGWCVKKPGLTKAEMYNPETDQWTDIADLPFPISGHKMELLEGRPTIIGGYDSEYEDQNPSLIQYFVETNEWGFHPTIQLRIPRSSAAVFQVPRELFRC